MALLLYMHIELLVLLLTVGVTRGDDKQKIFERPGLVWMENFHGNMYFHHMNLTSDTWESEIHGPKPSSVILARTSEYSFTHIDVAIGRNKTFVMVDTAGQRIVAFSFNDYGQHRPWTIFQGTSKKVNGIAIDWVTEVVYWTDAAYNVIMAASLQYPHHAEIVVDNLDEPFGIVVHPNKGFLFWTDADPDEPRLMRSTLGGRKIYALDRFYTGIATTLHLDIAEDRLYWLFEMNDGSGQRIRSCDLYGNHMAETRIEGNHRYFDMDIFNDQIIFANQDNNQIHFFSKRRSDKHNLVLDSGYILNMEEKPFGLRVIENYRHRSYGNPCLLSACPGICTRSNLTEDCFCIEALKRWADEQTIRMYCSQKYFSGLLLPKRDGIYTVWNNFGEHKHALPDSVVQPTRVFGEYNFINALTSDVRTAKIYFSDYSTKAIKSVRTQDGSIPEVISLAVEDVWGLAFDGISRNLYWTDSKLGHMIVTNEYGVHPFVLHDDLDQPMEIAINPKRRKLFWSQKYNGILSSSYLDGSDVETVVDLGKRRISGIAIDFKLHMLYVCTETSIIQLRERDEGNYTYSTVYIGASHRFTGITIMHDFLVVSDTAYHTSGLFSFEKPRVANGSLQSAGELTFPDLRLGNFYGVSFHHISNQPDGIDLCTMRKANCDQLCLPGYRNVRCVCGLGYITNGSRCEIERPFNPFLFVADQRYSKLLHVHALNGRFIAIPVQGLQQPYAVTYDPIGRMVYWTDLVTRTISRSDVMGRNQEVVVYDPNSYVVCLEFDPGSRLLFYIARHNRYSSSLLVYNVDTRRILNIMNRTLGDTRSMALNVANGYIFLIEQGNLLSLKINGTLLGLLIGGLNSTAVATVGEHVYFTDQSADTGRLLIKRSDLDGKNATIFLALKHAYVRDLTIDQDHLRIYWTNSTTRTIYRMRLTGTRRIEQIGPAKRLMKPAGLYLNTIRDSFESPCQSTVCDGVCLPSEEEAICKEAPRHVIDLETASLVSGLCSIPEVLNGDILNNQAGNVVPHGYTVTVKCYPQHSISIDGAMTCRNGQWTHVPYCTLDYEICGTPERGYKIYRQSGVYFAYPEVTKVDVICIGGGGGGYTEVDPDIRERGKAADGGRSSFGSYLIAEGGQGGTETAGGAGGYGHAPGGRGQYANNGCVTGGTAGQIGGDQTGQPGYSHYLFCGAGGYSHQCRDKDGVQERYAGPGGTEPYRKSAGYFGGGAGGQMGGSGGGGGWSRLTVNLQPKEVVPVSVGKAGYPSYGNPAPGVVIVTWGGFRPDEQFDIIDQCIFERDLI